MIKVVLGTLLLVCLVVCSLLWLWSPGKTKPYEDKEGKVLTGSISEVVRMEIGGIEQGMIIKGKNVSNPVLLFLHGGPGNPEYVLAEQYDIGLENYFTVCWWDQRGSGLSYSAELAPESVTLEQMMQDTVELTNYLQERFGQTKIYLMGHSFGSFLGISTVDQYPELFEAYIGIGQVTNQLESERLGYARMLTVAEEQDDRKSSKKLNAHTLDSVDKLTPNYLALRSSIMSKQGTGTFHAGFSKFSHALLPLLKAREYTLADKYGYLAGSLFMLKTPANEAQFTTNLLETISEITVPIYLIHGVYDRQVSYELAHEYFECVKAPKKEFYTFENSAHSPFIEEPQRFIQLIKENILMITNEGEST